MICFGKLREDPRNLIEKSKRLFAETLLIDIQTAMISLDVSETTRSAELRDQERRVALRAYEVINRFVETEKLMPEDSVRIAAALKPLKNRLDDIGPIPSPKP